MAITTWAATTGDWDDSKFSRGWDGPDIIPAKADLTLSSTAPSVGIGVVIIPEAVNLRFIQDYEWNEVSLTWNDSTGLGNWNTGISPRVAVGTSIAPDNADLTITGLAPAQGIIYTFPVDEADLTLTGSIPSAVEDSAGVIPKGDLTLTGSIPIATENQQENVPNADLTLSTTAPSRTLQRKISPAKADLTLTGQVPALGQSHFRTVGVGSLTGLQSTAGAWDDSTYTWATISNNWNTGTISPDIGITYFFTLDGASMEFTGYESTPWPFVKDPKFVPMVTMI